MNRLLALSAALLAAGCASDQAAKKAAAAPLPWCNPCTYPSACTSPCGPPAVAAAPAPVKPYVPPPVPALSAAFDPTPGEYQDAQQVKLTSPTPGAVIHYTTDGSTPTAASPTYGGPIAVDKTTTLRALVAAPGVPDSSVSQGEYVITPPPPPAQAAAPAPAPAPEAPTPPRAIAEIVAAQPVLPETVQSAIGASAELPTPLLYVDFSAERLTNTIRMLARSDSAGGLVQHLFALRMLFPEHALGAPAQVSATFASASRALRAPLEKLFVRLRMPRLTITGKDIEDREGREAMRALVDDLAFAPSASPQPAPSGMVRIVGGVELDVVRALLPELETAPVGAVVPWLINAQLLGTTIYHDGERSDDLEAYRAELLNVFSVLNELPIEEFHRVLTSSVNRTLDEALAHVLEALRGAAHLAVE